MKEENIELLKEIFDLGQDKMKNPGIQILLNKLFLNIEILRNYIEKIELKCDNFQASLHAKEYQLEQLKNENDILREVPFIL